VTGKDEQKVVLVTGAGSGIGRSTALAFARSGCKIAIGSDKESEVEEVRKVCLEAGAEAVGLIVDVREEAAVRGMVKQAVSRLGPVDIIVTSAGVIDLAPVSETDLSSWENLLAVNLTGTFLCVRECIDAMTERGWGRVICVSSLAGRIGSKYGAAYSASKHGVLGLVRSLALEVVSRGVTVNAICPGFVETRMAERIRPVEARLHGVDEKDLIRERIASLPMGRYLHADEIAPLALFLASDEAGGITGQAIGIDGGILPA